MAKIEIKDLPREMKISSQEMRTVRGGRYRDPRFAPQKSWMPVPTGGPVAILGAITGDNDDGGRKSAAP